MTLAGKRIVITRALSQSDSFAAALVERGAIPLLYPCIAIEPVEDTTRLDALLIEASQGKFDWLVITSLNTVDVILKRADALNLRFDGMKVIAVGRHSAESAQAIPGVRLIIPDSDTLSMTFVAEAASRFLLPQSDAAPDTLAKHIAEVVDEVVTVTAYRNVIGSGGVDLPALLRDNAVDAITFMSSSAATNFVVRMSPLPALTVPVICIGEPTAKTAREAGLPVTRVADNSLEGVLRELEAEFQSTTG